MTKDDIRSWLLDVPHPARGGSVVETGALLKVAECDGYVSVTLDAGGLTDDQRGAMSQATDTAIRTGAKSAGASIAEIHVEFQQPAPAPGASRQPQGPAQERAPSMPNIKHVIAVGAGKGGVGKSTISVGLAIGLAKRGHTVGIMDGDIYGPSLPTMLGLDTIDVEVQGDRIQPMLVHGVRATTLGKMVDAEKPLIWRGPMAHGAFTQLLERTEWGELDYLIIDLPPGTGDISLSMAQTLQLTGAVVACTPQKVAQDDAIRAVRMFQQLGIDILGIVENMSYFVCEHGSEYDIFGRGGAEQMAQRLGLPFLGAIPIDSRLRANADLGRPDASFGDGEVAAPHLKSMVEQVENQAALALMRSGSKTPTLKIS